MFLRGHLWVSYQGIFFSSFPTYKNQTFTNPDPDEPVSDASLLQDKPQPVMFAPQGKDEHRGIFLVNLHSPLNSGTAGINAKYNELAAWFTAGRRFIHNGTGVSVRSCGRGRGREDDGWWTVPVSINWYTKLHRGV